MNKKNILKFIILFLCILFWNLIINVVQNDEIWNYGFAHNIYKGLIPYRDFNMVITPFYPFISSLLFHVFGSSLLVFHIENAFILTILFFIIYELIKEKVYIVGLFIAFFSDSLTFPSYNLFLLFLIFVIIYLEKKNSNDYLIGFIIGLSFLTKQSIGFFFILPSIYYLFVNYRKVIKRAIGFLIPCTIFLLYLLYYKCLNQFLDLCLFGLFDFGVKNTSSFNFGYIYFFIYILITLYMIFKNKKNISNFYVLAFASMMLPLFDVHHSAVAYVVLIVVFLLNSNFKIRLNLRLIFYPCCFFIGFIMFTTYNQGFKINYPNKIKHFEYRFIRDDSIDFTNNVVDYMKKNNDKDFIFIGSGAYYYRLVTDNKITYLDLINYGNFGYNGSEKIIKMIKKRKQDNSVFVISEDDLLDICQVDKTAVRYIIENGRKIDSVQIYDFYVLD